MDCVNHPGVAATAFCQNCGRPLCANCAKKGMTLGAATQILCEQCLAGWQQAGASPFGAAGSSGTPNPAAAAALGIIPGVGAMYNGQFFKGLVHVVIFAVLITVANHYDIFGIFIAAWIAYQSFEAYHVARARRDGQPLPDPLGLNEVGNWLNIGGHTQNPPPGPQSRYQPGQQPPVNPNPGPNPSQGWTQQGPYQQAPPQGFHQAGFYAADPQEPQYQQVHNPPPGGFPVPPIPPIPPRWRGREPIGAVILIGLGLVFLLNEMGWVTEKIVEYTWPLILIALGLWMIVRRVGENKGGSQ